MNPAQHPETSTNPQPASRSDFCKLLQTSASRFRPVISPSGGHLPHFFHFSGPHRETHTFQFLQLEEEESKFISLPN